ncbi:STAS domain-containing protein [Streptomyces sp. CA-132043]|uniref:STAS domain-containing protein n=1 Tax=Streptomyces sp. CA-132043 TaxID=3240048 RepID=UPI003D8F41F2
MDVLYEDDLLQIRHTVTPYGLAISGDVDATNQAVLTRCLLSLDGVCPYLTVDLHKVRFISFSAVHVLASFAHALEPGRRLVLLTCAPAVGRMLRACGWDEMAGLQMTVMEEDNDA